MPFIMTTITVGEGFPVYCEASYTYGDYGLQIEDVKVYVTCRDGHDTEITKLVVFSSLWDEIWNKLEDYFWTTIRNV